MNWVKENKFLATWIAFVVLGAAALGYLVLDAKGRYSEVSDAYDQQSQELNRLERLAPYPNAKSLKALDDQRKDFVARIDALQKKLAEVELPVKPMTPEQFQDKLKKAFDEFEKKAAEAHLKLPERFYMGFERYQTEPPKPEAAGPLGRELDAIEIVLNQMLEAHVTELRSLAREDLPEEKNEKSKPADTTSAPGEKKKGDKGAEKERVKKYPFEMVIFSEPAALRQLLNGIVTSQKQFFIVRDLTVRNEKDKGPARLDPAAMAAAAAPATGTPVAPGAPAAPAPAAPARAQAFIVGEERLETALRLEIADFADTPSTAAK